MRDLGIGPRRRFGAAPGYSPLAAFGADTELWLDAADTGTRYLAAVGGAPAGSTDPCGAWADKSGKLDGGAPRHATQGTASMRPTCTASALAFDGGDNIVTPAFAASAPPNTLAIVGRVTNNGGALVDGSAPRTIVSRGANAATYTVHNGLSLTAGAASPDLSARRAFVAEFNGASSRSFVNNAPQASGNAGALGTSNLSIGGISGDFLVGEVCEVVLVGRLLTAQELAALHAYFQAKWGL
ncbi:MAG TPA: hypothetical protein VFS43_17755 [Polyangiaceae bacterium]|nr:hypothetical protein [Polyangiaceae bacterium]